MFDRALAGPLRAALGDTPVVFVHGARQTGKTTLVRELIRTGHPASYLTLDQAKVMEAVRGDPEGFVSQLETPVVLDEVQLAPEVFRAIKIAVDRDRRPGRFLLTGSTHLMVLPQLSEALAGRIEILTLWPLSQGEIAGAAGRAIDTLFSDQPLVTGSDASTAGGSVEDDLLTRVARGGYPEVVTRASSARRRAWFEAYLTTIMQRDVRDLANLAEVDALTGLLRLLAARVTGLLNATELSRSSGIPRTTLRRYLALLEGTFLLQRIPAWSTNLSKRLVRSPKVSLIDSGLLCHLLGLDTRRLAADPTARGSVLECFVIQELTRQIGWSETRPRLFHYRTHGGQEVDAVLEDAAGRVVGVEVKGRATVTSRDFRGLRGLEEALGDRFQRGVVFHTGTDAVPFGARRHALPISWLWARRTRSGDVAQPGAGG